MSTAQPSSPFAARISHAIGLMQQGQWMAAEQTVAQILTADAREPDGLQLMGLVRAQQGRTREAEDLYRRSLALRPRQANVQINLAQLLAGTQRMAEAIALLRGALRGEPNNADLLVVLAQLQQVSGDSAFAEKNLRAALKLRPGDGSIVLSLSGLLNTAERAEEAQAVLREALAQTHPAGMRAALEHNLAVALKLQRRYGEALALFDTAIAHLPDLPAVSANRASTLQHLGRHDEALAGYRDALRKDPTHLASHQEMNALLYRLGRDDEFLVSLDEALAKAPEHAELLVTKGAFLNRTGRHAEAAEAFERAAHMRPDEHEVLGGLALALTGLKRHDDAVATYERSLTVRPDVVQTRVNLAGVLLEMGEGERALDYAQSAVQRAPQDQAALAVHELALRINRDPRAQALLDFDKHVQIFELDMPDGFNAELNTYLDTLHGDAREHFDQTLRRGSQTLDPLFEGDNPLVAQLRVRVEEAVAAYIAGMDGGDGHPLSGRRTDGFRFAGSWSSRLRDQGFHTNHIHPRGWISSCYYVDVPEVAQDQAAQQGWIKFGEPTFRLGANDLVRRTVQPVPGRLVLFPSYMWHGTIPFRAPTARTTIAFDAVPR